MNRDDQVMEALLELSVQLGVSFPAARQALYVARLDAVPLHAVLWAIGYAAENWEIQTMPQVGTLKKFAAMAPPLPSAMRPYNERQIAECTVTQAEDAKRWLADLAAGLVDQVKVAA